MVILRGLMMSNALKHQHDKEDDEKEVIMSDLQNEVDRLHDSFRKKDDEIASLKPALANAQKENEK